MAFTKRTWIARDVQYPGRKILTPTGNTNEYDVTRSEGTVSAEGDILSAENLNDLEQRILSAFGEKLDSSIISTGTWTPTLYGSTTPGTPTYTSQSGTYYKIGSLVYLYFSIAISAKGGIAGNICFGGLPFALSGRGFLDISSYAGLTTPSSSIPAGLMTGSLVSLYYKINTLINPCTDSMISDTFALYGATAIYTTA